MNDIREEIWSLVPTNARLQKLMFPSVQVSLWTCDEVEDVLFSDFFGVGGGVEGGDGCGGCGAREEEKAEGYGECDEERETDEGSPSNDGHLKLKRGDSGDDEGGEREKEKEKEKEERENLGVSWL